jgi:hypothetical protein
MDRREAILDRSFHEEGLDFACREITTKKFKAAINAMDTYMKETVLEAFEFVAKNTTGHSIDEKGNVEFKYKGEWITSKQLFENFL